MGALGLWRPHLPCPGHGELQAKPTGDQAAQELLTLTLRPSPQPVACRRSGPRRCTETLSVDVVVHVCMCAWRPQPGLVWQQQQQQQHSTPLPPPPTDPLSLVTERHRHTLTQDGGQPLDPVGTMGSTAALQVCRSAALEHPDGSVCSTTALIASPHLTRPVRRRVLASRRPVRPNDNPQDHRFYLFPGSTLLQYSGPKAPLMLQPEEPEARLTSPSSCTSATTAMPPCPALPCLALPCALAPPGSSSAPGLNWTCLFWVGLALVDVSFLPACRGLAALLSAGSAVDSSEDTSPSLSHRWSS